MKSAVILYLYMWLVATHSKHFLSELHVWLPLDDYGVRQVWAEVEDSSTRCGQVGAGKQSTDEETQADRSQREGQHEDKQHRGIRMLQHAANL